jgi:hypothetical protein
MKRFVLPYLLLLGFCFALPGGQPPAEVLSRAIATGRVSQNEQARLRWIPSAHAEQVEVFTSSTGRTHVRFLLVNGEREAYRAIMYQGDWTPEDKALLEGGAVGLLGYWESYRGEPSFVAVWLTPAEAVTGATAQASPPASAAPRPSTTPAKPQPTLLQIRQASVSKVEKFISQSKKIHIRFEFVVNGKRYRGIMFEGDWNTDYLNRLRSGKATLIGYWDTYEGSPSFVTKRVAP